jgi:probable phosphoglycerate mutase
VEVTLYIVRHGKTLLNAAGRVQGSVDSPLTETGLAQAAKVGKGMKDISFIGAYSGDLGRQRHTAQLILAENANPPPLTELYGLREWNYGGFEGKLDAEMWTPVMKSCGLTFDADRTGFARMVAILGDRGIAEAIAAADPLGTAEHYDEILKRSREAIDRIIRESANAGGGNVLVVSSGGMIPTILTMLVPDQYNAYAIIDNCTVTTLTYKAGVYTLGIVGDRRYLN